MEVTFINVGYGDAMLVQSGGFTLMLDGGSAMAEEFRGFPHRIPAAEYLKKTGVSHIDLLVITHIHEDHVCGLEAVLDSIPIHEIRVPFSIDIFEGAREVFPGEGACRSAYLFSEALNSAGRLLKKAKEKGIPVKTLLYGERLELPGGSSLYAAAPDRETRESFEDMLRSVFRQKDPTQMLTELDAKSNDACLVLSIRQGDIGCLLPGDNCPRNWHRGDINLIKNENVLKLPHHGQKDSIDVDLMKDMPLKAVITTASSDRRYNSANREVYRALEELHPGVDFLFTDEREYLPYFSRPEGFQAIKLVMDFGKIHPEFVKIK